MMCLRCCQRGTGPVRRISFRIVQFIDAASEGLAEILIRTRLDPRATHKHLGRILVYLLAEEWISAM
jgi:hypothetical protein